MVTKWAASFSRIQAVKKHNLKVVIFPLYGICYVHRSPLSPSLSLSESLLEINDIVSRIWRGSGTSISFFSLSELLDSTNYLNLRDFLTAQVFETFFDKDCPYYGFLLGCTSNCTSILEILCYSLCKYHRVIDW